MNELTVVAKGGSGIEIKTILPEKFNLVEFSFRDDVPITIFISPWMQFEPVKLNEFRLQCAYEIVRRSLAYEDLVKQVERLQKTVDMQYKAADRKYETLQKTYDMWREERVKYGLPEDFSDIKEWPPEMMSNY